MFLCVTEQQITGNWMIAIIINWWDIMQFARRNTNQKKKTKRYWKQEMGDKETKYIQVMPQYQINKEWYANWGQYTFIRQGKIENNVLCCVLCVAIATTLANDNKIHMYWLRWPTKSNMLRMKSMALGADDCRLENGDRELGAEKKHLLNYVRRVIKLTMN